MMGVKYNRRFQGDHVGRDAAVPEFFVQADIRDSPGDILGVMNLDKHYGIVRRKAEAPYRLPAKGVAGSGFDGIPRPPGIVKDKRQNSVGDDAVDSARVKGAGRSFVGGDNPLGFDKPGDLLSVTPP